MAKMDYNFNYVCHSCVKKGMKKNKKTFVAKHPNVFTQQGYVAIFKRRCSICGFFKDCFGFKKGEKNGKTK